jgi:hypothetical protein
MIRKALCIVLILNFVFLISCSNIDDYRDGITGNSTNTAIKDSVTISSLNSSSPSISTSIVSGFEKFMQDNNMTLTAKDVQYDMVNNLDKEFGLDGYAELDDYYNYGFDDTEKDYFCIDVTPIDGKYNDQWYIYCHRDSFKEVFDCLKSNSQRVFIKCIIPKSRYEENMNNMAFAESIMW